MVYFYKITLFLKDGIDGHDDLSVVLNMRHHSFWKNDVWKLSKRTSFRIWAK